MLAGRDLLGAAQTGTGKTAAFVLPILQRLSESTKPASGARSPRVLVLVPTRELAAQVEESVRTYGRHLRFASTTIFGGVSMHGQIQALKRGVDLLVATPGRLIDHMEQRTIDLRSIEVLVLDEADRMLDMGFIHAIKRILPALPAKRQNLMFSATFSPDIRKLAHSFLHDPATVEVARAGTPAELVTQVAHFVDNGRKRELLAHLIEAGDWQQVLVFTRTKHGANRLAQQLAKGGIESDAIHGNKAQNARTRALAGFKDGRVRVLVATDIAARGIDIDELPHVVNFDLPNVPEDYVHRIGRTGRAGSEGVAASLVTPDDEPYLRAIEKLINRTIPIRDVPGFATGAAAPRAVQPQRQQPRAQQPREQQQPRREQQAQRGERGRGAQPRRDETRRDAQPRRDEPRRDSQPRRDDARRAEQRRPAERGSEPRRNDHRRNDPRQGDRRRDDSAHHNGRSTVRQSSDVRYERAAAPKPANAEPARTHETDDNSIWSPVKKASKKIAALLGGGSRER